MPNLTQILIHFSPELLLTVGALAVLIYDMVVHGRDRGQAWLAGATLIAAIAATLWLYTVPQPAVGIFEARNAVGEVTSAGAFMSDGFTHFFRLVSLLVTLLVMLSGVAYMRRRTPYRGEFFALLLFASLAMNLMAGANDLIVIALSIELLSISSYILTAFLRDDKLSIEGGLKYFLYGAVTSAVMLFGLSLLFGATGSTSLPTIAEAISQPHSLVVVDVRALVVPALLLILVGVGFKISLVPFHQWAPDAYHGAPTPITGFLSVGPKAAGFAVLIRLLVTAFNVPDLHPSWPAALTGICLITMILGNVAALIQTNIKRMMAYSAIAQAGFMLIGVVSLGGGKLPGIEPLGSVLIFILAYVFTNLGAFAVIIAVDDGTGSSDITAFAGLMGRAPFMAVGLLIFFLSLVGIPPLAGFIGKFSVFSSAIAADHVWLALVGVLTGVISVGYYFRVVREMFFGEPTLEPTPLRMAPGLAFVAVVALFMVFAIGLYAGPFIELANSAAGALSPMLDVVARAGQ